MTTDDPRVAEAIAYVTGRFFPPLPPIYGYLAVLALDLINDEDDTPIDVTEVNPRPRAARQDDSGGWSVSPLALVSALRITHLLEED